MIAPLTIEALKKVSIFSQLEDKLKNVENVGRRIFSAG